MAFVAFSLDDVAWMAMGMWFWPEWNPWDFNGTDAGVPMTGLPQGRYCNVASLTGALPMPAKWRGSNQQAQCKDAYILVGGDGRVEQGGYSAPAGGKPVVIHKDYTL